MFFRYDLGTIVLNKVGKLRKYHQFIGVFSIKKGTFDHKSTNQPKTPEENEKSSTVEVVANKEMSFYVIIFNVRRFL